MTNFNKQGNVFGPAGPMSVTLSKKPKNKDPLIIDDQEDEDEEEKGLSELWKNRWLRINLICSCMVWLHGSFNFYMITFYLKYFPGNIFVNAMSFASADLMAYASSGVVLKFFSIKQGLWFSYGLATTASVAYLFLYKSENELMIPLLVASCRVGGSMSFNIGYVSVAKLFPTEYVTTTFGIVNLFSHLITIAAPMMAEAPEPIPMVVFTANCISALVFASWLLEY